MFFVRYVEGFGRGENDWIGESGDGWWRWQ